MKDSRHLTPLLPLLLLILGSCSPDEPPPPDVSHIDVPLTVLRFDRALAELDTTTLDTEMARLDETFGDFTDVYFTHIVPLRGGDLNPAESSNVLRAYLEYPLTRFVDSIVGQRFGAGPQVQRLTEELRQSLRYYKHYLPGAPLPDTLVTYDSHFELAAFLYGDGQLAAGLEFFLGPDFDYQLVNPEEPIFSDYLARSYTPAHFTGKLLRVLIEDRFPAPRSGRLIDYLVYEGKKLYLLDLLQPETPDHVVYEVSPEEMEWLRDNETEIYAYLQRENELYATDVNKIKKYTGPAPYSQGMPRESPGGAVNYVGRQIVASFLSANPDVSIAELMAMQDGQDILRRARYKPR
ncbi:hypothetical protein [Lewinella sp. JB7]|uniref:gliding motility protein GldB-related protein n=1 Tax=Lewinella sp. JB7 TaxID=2962887 RepID=UPI0020C9EA0C|nr:hypothetical protein [Lewinella sp. JB7]MCP9237458.1 hypothetical protein [Lewinella sp. JB7]